VRGLLWGTGFCLALGAWLLRERLSARKDISLFDLLAFRDSQEQMNKMFHSARGGQGTVRLSNGTELAYSDSGAPTGLTDYDTLIMVHGCGFNKGMLKTVSWIPWALKPEIVSNIVICMFRLEKQILN
jgi:hypothetical protein